MGRWRPMTSSVGWRPFGPACGTAGKPTCWMCPATRRCGTCTGVGRRDGRARRVVGEKCRFDGRMSWAAAQPMDRWQEFTVQEGQKGPIQVQAVMTRVRTRQDHRLGPEEGLIVIRHLESDGSEPDVSYHLTWAPQEVPLENWVRTHARRHQIEQMLEHGKGEAGLDHYEVRSYVGWHHHMTLSLLALWFLSLERLAMGKKDAGSDGAAGAGDSDAAVAASGPHGATDCPGGQHRARPQRTSENLPLACSHGSVPAASASRRLRMKRLQ